MMGRQVGDEKEGDMNVPCWMRGTHRDTDIGMDAGWKGWLDGHTGVCQKQRTGTQMDT